MSELIITAILFFIGAFLFWNHKNWINQNRHE